jgi:hypothetical protein
MLGSALVAPSDSPEPQENSILPILRILSLSPVTGQHLLHPWELSGSVVSVLVGHSQGPPLGPWPPHGMCVRWRGVGPLPPPHSWQPCGHTGE